MSLEYTDAEYAHYTKNCIFKPYLVLEAILIFYITNMLCSNGIHLYYVKYICTNMYVYDNETISCRVLEILELFFRTKNFKKTAPGVPVAYVIVKK